MSERNNTDLVVNALVMALGRRNPGDDALHHADRGSPYTSIEFTNRLNDWNLNPSGLPLVWLMLGFRNVRPPGGRVGGLFRTLLG